MDCGSCATPLGEHGVQNHGAAVVEMTATILAPERDTSLRRTLEAFWRAAKNRKIARNGGGAHRGDGRDGLRRRPLRF